MKLVITEKNDAAEKIADLLSIGQPKLDKVFNVPVYKFNRDGEQWVTIGLRGHILEPDFVETLTLKNKKWVGKDEDGTVYPACLPSDLPKPPFKKKKPFTVDSVELKAWKMEALPYLVYAPIKKNNKEKNIIRSIKNLGKKATSVVIGTDFDREGELIGSDALNCVLEVNPNIEVSRARYSAFTKEEIVGAFNNLVEVDENLADAGESRQYIDLIWGAVLTRYLTIVKFAGYGNVRSSGRVQTPTLALIVARERERLAFVPQDYWVIKAQFMHEGTTEVFTTHEVARFTDLNEANAVMAKIEGAKTGIVKDVEKKRRQVTAPAPFNTTSLIAAASSEGLSPARTMRIAESLYMKGYISYPRVDNTVYPASLNLAETVSMLKASAVYAPYCNKLLAQPSLKATRGKKETTDHPPIYPTAACEASHLDAADYKLYNLIARRFLATLSGPATVEGSKIIIDVNSENFIAKGDVLVVPGFREIYQYGLKKDEQLPALSHGDSLEFVSADCAHKQTEPPARYSQGKLIQEMEKLGLGTKSTRHAIIERLYTVKYVQNEPIEPSSLGMAVCDALDRFAPTIVNPEMTAHLEKSMDDIANGETTQEDVVLDSRIKLAEQLENLIPKKDEVAEALSDAVAADAYVGPCPKCGKDLQIRVSAKTRSSFIGCTGWPECDVTFPLPQGKIETMEESCETCGCPQIKVTPFRSKARIFCIDPDCATNVEPDIDVGVCPVCLEHGQEKRMFARKNPRSLKRFVRCENYEVCENGYPLPQYGKITPTQDACEGCGAPMIIVTTARGPWKLCPNFSCPLKEEANKKKSTKKRTYKKK